MSYYPLRSVRIGFLGAGRIAESFVRAYLDYSTVSKENIFLSGRNFKKTKRIVERFQVQMVLDNDELLNQVSVIFVCVKPFDAQNLFQTLKKPISKPSYNIELNGGSFF